MRSPFVNLNDLIGKKFNRLSVVDVVMGRYQKELLCICDCGNIIQATHFCLKKGNTGSCGCLNKELVSKRSKKHGQCNKTPEYKSWSKMKERCLNPNCPDYPDYGGKGIKICARWLDFTGFLKIWVKNHQNYIR